MSLAKIDEQDKQEEKQTVDLVYVAPEERGLASSEKSIFFRPQERTLEELADVLREHLSESKPRELNTLRNHGVAIIGIGGHIGVIHAEHQSRAQELMEILDRMDMRQDRGIVFANERNIVNIEECRGHKTLADFAGTVESEIKAEIMIISKRIDDYDVAVNIEKETPKYDKYAKHHHKFHNQKPSKAKGIYGNSRRK